MIDGNKTFVVKLCKYEDFGSGQYDYCIKFELMISWPFIVVFHFITETRITKKKKPFLSLFDTEVNLQKKKKVNKIKIIRLMIIGKIDMGL